MTIEIIGIIVMSLMVYGIVSMFLMAYDIVSWRGKRNESTRPRTGLALTKRKPILKNEQ